MVRSPIEGELVKFIRFALKDNELDVKELSGLLDESQRLGIATARAKELIEEEMLKTGAIFVDPSFVDYYSLLSVRDSAIASEIEAAFKKQYNIWNSRAHVPKFKAEVTEKQNQLILAKKTLLDPSARREFDTKRAKILAGASQPRPVHAPLPSPPSPAPRPVSTTPLPQPVTPHPPNPPVTPMQEVVNYATFGSAAVSSLALLFWYREAYLTGWATFGLIVTGLSIALASVNFAHKYIKPNHHKNQNWEGWAAVALLVGFFVDQKIPFYLIPIPTTYFVAKKILPHNPDKKYLAGVIPAGLWGVSLLTYGLTFGDLRIPFPVRQTVSAPSPTPVAQAIPINKRGWVLGDYVNLRSSPGTDGSTIGPLFKNTPVDVLELYQESGFYKVRLTDNSIGYVSSLYVSLQEQPTTVPQSKTPYIPPSTTSHELEWSTQPDEATSTNAVSSENNKVSDVAGTKSSSKPRTSQLSGEWRGDIVYSNNMPLRIVLAAQNETIVTGDVYVSNASPIKVTGTYDPSSDRITLREEEGKSRFSRGVYQGKFSRAEKKLTGEWTSYDTSRTAKWSVSR